MAACMDKTSNEARVRMYVLDDRLQQKARDIEQLLTGKCDVKFYYELERTDYDELSIGEAITEARKKEVRQHTPYLTDELTDHKYHPFEDNLGANVVDIKSMIDLVDDGGEERNKEDPDTIASTSQGVSRYEVVIVLGHSNVFNFGPFSICDILEAVLRHKPVIVAFLGCCGGSVRYGPLLMISQMRGLKTIFGFYQRRIYTDELLQTSLVIGIRNYLRFSSVPQLHEVESRLIAKHSFVHAALELIFHHPNVPVPKHDDNAALDKPSIPDDPTIFANDSDQLSTVQMFLDTLEKKFSEKNIPLSCLHLALFHTYTFEESPQSAAPHEEIKSSIEIFIEEIKLCDDSEIEKKCICEIKRRHLNDIIEMAAQIQFLHVSQETLMYLKDGRWQDVDHLQFFVAVLHGYWGKNSYKDIRACAYFHLEEMRKEVNMGNSSSLQKYLLCAIGFCLFCEKTGIVFELPAEFHVVGFVLYSPVRLKQQFPTNGLLSLPDGGDLPWVKRFGSCKEDDKYIQLYVGRIETIKISNYYNREIRRNQDYNYTREDLVAALNALWRYIFCIDPFPHDDTYTMKKFDNKPSRDKGHMQCFKQTDLEYAEMWVTTNQNICHRCRFVYQYYQYYYNHNDERCKGILYFTDSHYGWDLIPEDQVNQYLRSGHGTTEGELNKLDFYDKLSKLDKRELYDLQDQIMKGFFPFSKIGGLKMKKNPKKIDLCPTSN